MVVEHATQPELEFSVQYSEELAKMKSFFTTAPVLYGQTAEDEGTYRNWSNGLVWFPKDCKRVKIQIQHIRRNSLVDVGLPSITESATSEFKNKPKYVL